MWWADKHIGVWINFVEDGIRAGLGQYRQVSCKRVEGGEHFGKLSVADDNQNIN